jgi:hypothetical protein
LRDGPVSTKILVATEGSESVTSAIRAAAELSAKTDSGIEFIYVGKDISTPAAYDDPSSSDIEAARKSREMLDGVTKEIEEDGGKAVERTSCPARSRLRRSSSSPASRTSGWSLSGAAAVPGMPYREASRAPWSARPDARSSWQHFTLRRNRWRNRTERGGEAR